MSFFSNIINSISQFSSSTSLNNSNNVLHSFISEFGDFFHEEKPPFLESSFLEAFRTAYSSHTLLFIYLHSPYHESSLDFCQSLSSVMVVDFLKTNFICWAGNVCAEEGYFLSEKFGVTGYPYYCVINVISTSPIRFRFVGSYTGYSTDAQIIDCLVKFLDNYNLIEISERKTSESRNEATTIRYEQDIEYKQALLQDQEAEIIRQQEKLIEKQKEQEEERKEKEKERMEKEKEEKRKKLHDDLPEEPSLHDPNAVLLCIRLPDGSRHQRRFLKSDPMKHLFDFIDCFELFSTDNTIIENYNIVQLLPKTIFSDRSKTFEEYGLTSRSSLYVQEIN